MASPRVYTTAAVSFLFIATAYGLSFQSDKHDPPGVSGEITWMHFTEQVIRYGYQVTEHSVVTEDGYVLALFHLQKPGVNVTGLPVLLVPGLLESASAWIDAGPTIGLGYLLAPGRDIWFANARGTTYGRKHVRLNPDTDSAFWNFSVDEIGKYDLPVTIDYVLNKTGADKLNYVGFSQGGGTFFIMCLEKPEYSSKVNLMIAVAPATRQLNSRLGFRQFCEFFAKHESILAEAGVFEVFPRGGIMQTLFQTLCMLPNLTRLCEIFKDIVDAPNPGSIRLSTLRAIVGGFPAGASVHNLAWYGQSMKCKEFQKFDYGMHKNLMLYGSDRPPIYNLSAVAIPVVVIYGRNDGIEAIEDEEWLIGKLPNLVESYEVKDPLWTHLDVHYSRKVSKLLLPKIEEYLNKFRYMKHTTFDWRYADGLYYYSTKL